MIECDVLTDPANGQVNISSGTIFGSTATYSCNNGYTLSGSVSRTCGASGFWSGSEPTCEGIARPIIINIILIIIHLQLLTVVPLLILPMDR